MNAHDPVNRPAHYMGADGLQAIDVVEDWGLGAHLAAAFTYVIRAPRKGNMIEDCQKAIWYLERAQRDNVVETLAIANAPFTIGILQVCVAFDVPRGELRDVILDIFQVALMQMASNRQEALSLATSRLQHWIRGLRPAEVAP